MDFSNINLQSEPKTFDVETLKKLNAEILDVEIKKIYSNIQTIYNDLLKYDFTKHGADIGTDREFKNNIKKTFTKILPIPKNLKITFGEQIFDNKKFSVNLENIIKQFVTKENIEKIKTKKFEFLIKSEKPNLENFEYLEMFFITGVNSKTKIRFLSLLSEILKLPFYYEKLEVLEIKTAENLENNPIEPIKPDEQK